MLTEDDRIRAQIEADDYARAEYDRQLEDGTIDRELAMAAARDAQDEASERHALAVGAAMSEAAGIARAERELAPAPANPLDIKPPSQWTNLDLAVGARQPQVLDKLAEFDDLEIRLAVAANPNTSDKALAKLAAREDSRDAAQAAIRQRDESARRRELESPSLVDDAFPDKVRVVLQVEHNGDQRRSYLRDRHGPGERDFATIAEARLAGREWLSTREPRAGEAHPTFLIVAGKGRPTEDEVIASRTRVALAALPRSDFPEDDYAEAKAAFSAAHDRSGRDSHAKAALPIAQARLEDVSFQLVAQHPDVLVRLPAREQAMARQDASRALDRLAPDHGRDFRQSQAQQTHQDHRQTL